MQPLLLSILRATVQAFSPVGLLCFYLSMFPPNVVTRVDVST